MGSGAELLVKFVQKLQGFTQADWLRLTEALDSGDRETVAEMLGLTEAEADVAFKGVESLVIRH